MRSKKTTLVFILMTVLAVTAKAQQYTPESDFSAKIIDNGRGVEIIKYTGSKQIVNIPPTMEGIPVTSIGQEAFLMCTNLTSITIPNSITNIGKGAFFGCTGLTSITIPASVTSIGDRVFLDSTSLAAINVDAGNTNYSSEQGILYNKDKTLLIQYPGGKTGAFTIPNSVTDIGRYSAFKGCTSLTSINIPNIKKTARFT